MVKALTDLVATINSLSDDISTTNELTRIAMQTISDEIASGQYSADAISSAVGDAIAKSIQQGLIDETKLIIDSGVAVQVVEAAVKSVDWTAIGKGIGSDDSVQLASVELQLAALYAEKELFTASSNTTIVDAQKQLMNTTKSALDVLKKSQKELQAGWVASIDGVVTECNVEAGVQTSALQTGIKIENLNELSVTISLGEYDVHKVSVGLPATIKSAYGTYTGEIVSIAPTATGSSSNSLLDSVGSMAGISGLSSLTDKGAGVECVIKVNEPDDNIIAGFEANVEIKTGSYSDVPVVPIESIILEKEGTYVYKYNEEDETVTKTKIETGATSDTAYEVVSGISIGDKIISTPASDYEEETFKVRLK
jgi:HlyD family secretion protein